MSFPSYNNDQAHYDVAEHVYEGAKGVWAWGKGIAVFKPFMGIAEGITNKVLSIAGTSLQHIDGMVSPKLSDFDNGVLNPAIANIVGVLMQTVSKGKETMGPVIQKVLNIAGSTKIEDKKIPEPAPEVTPGSSTYSTSFIRSSERMSLLSS